MGNIVREVKLSLAPLWRSRRGLVGLSIVTFFLLMASIGPLIVPLEWGIYPERIFAPPSLEHPLGTDWAGRDVLSMIVHSSPSVLSVGFLAGFITLLLGASAGITSGFVGGKVDKTLMTSVDFLLTIPGVPLILVLGTLLREVVLNPLALAALLSLSSWAGLARAIRSQTLALKEREFIEASKCLGLSTPHIVFRDLLPNLSSYIAIGFVYAVIGAVFAQVGLYFLGVLPYTSLNWGVMLNQAIAQGALLSERATHYLLAPLITIILLQTGMICLSFGLEEIFNPRLRTE